MPNRLAHESSPYLRQHAANPVQWYPWGEEALALARQEGRPILLSIGYSACHWCHVMAHESFEDEATAQVMNRHFINIKVDREERPDLDHIYQSAHQLLMRRAGGWPLTMFLTPDQVPFFGGTYFPPEPRHGLPAFTDLLERVAAFLAQHPEQIADQNSAMVAALEGMVAREGAVRLDGAPLQRALRQLEHSFDAQHGGFGGAPKFPHTTDLSLLLRAGIPPATDPQPLAMVHQSLRAMATGGLYDQLGGGFFRYSVDERWLIPHFEKMLYDNGPLLALYADAWAATAEPLFRATAEGVAEWMVREMEGEGGGFFATQDADSEGEEGRFYLWRPAEAQALLTPEQWAVVSAHYGLDGAANFEGRWHLYEAQPLTQVATALALPLEQVTQLRDSARAVLFAARAARPAPGRDEKRITSWNGLAIYGLAVAGRRLGRPDLIAAAERALDFIRHHLLANGRLLAVYKDGLARLPGYLDDYAFLLAGLLALLEARWRDVDLSLALTLADTLLLHFEDEAGGGFYFTADDHETLIHRPKPLADESMPAGNGVAATALLRLAHLTGDLHYQEAAERTLLTALPLLGEHAYAHGAILLALGEWLAGTETIILRGSEAESAPWRARLAEGFHPHRLVVTIPPQVVELPGLLAERQPSAAGVVAYRCVAGRCEPPVTDLAALLAALAADGGSAPPAGG